MNAVKKYLYKSKKLIGRSFSNSSEPLRKNILFNIQKYIPVFRNEYFYRRLVKTENKDEDSFVLNLIKKQGFITAKTDFEIYKYTPWLNTRINGKILSMREKYIRFFEYKNQLLMRRIQIYIVILMIIQVVIIFIQTLNFYS
jgi:hypothetical protein